MDVWNSRSAPGKQMLLSAGCALVGIVLLLGSRGGAGGPNATAAFWSGVLLLIIGVVGVLASGPQTITIDSQKRRIVVEDSFLLGAKKQRSILFSDIVRVGIGYLGKRSNGVTFYYLSLQLRSGQRYSLFAPGRFYPGASDRVTVEGWQHRLEDCIAQSRLR